MLDLHVHNKEIFKRDLWIAWLTPSESNPKQEKNTYPTSCYLHPASWAALEQIPWSEASQWFGHRTRMSSVARDWRSSTATQINPAYHQPLEQWLIADICGSHGISLGWMMDVDHHGFWWIRASEVCRKLRAELDFTSIARTTETNQRRQITARHLLYGNCSHYLNVAVSGTRFQQRRKARERLCGCAFCNVHSIGPSVTCVIMVVSLSCGGTSLSWATCTSLMP